MPLHRRRLRVTRYGNFANSNPNLREELEAGDFAMQSLEPEAAGLHNAWMNIALHPQTLIDALVSLRAGSHALTINRLQSCPRAVAEERPFR